MSANRLCPQCGKVMPPDSPEGLCPACLLLLTATSLGNPPPPGPGSYAEPPETETKALPPGTRLGYVGDYELIEEIARGGMGVVYKARQTSLKRIVAVKMIRSGGLADETEVARFRAEAEAAANLKHPNIVAIHEIGEHDGRHYFSMDYVAGKNLAQFADGKPVAARQAAEWLKEIAEAVQFAHQRGVLHRDLKPQNILMDAEGRPHVTDFGLAKNLHADSGVTQTGAVMGSPSYMAPEQARGRNDLVGTASDVYSLGAILYQLVTGRAPFLGDSPIETLHCVVNDEPTRPCSLNPDTPVDLETICLKCLEKDPTRRYPTARALAEDLERFLAGEPILARPAGPARKALTWIKHRPALMAGTAALLIVGLFYTAYYLLQENAFLRAQQLNPKLERVRGPWTEALFTAVGPLGGLMFIAMVWVGVWFKKHTLRTTWSGLFDHAQHGGTWPAPTGVRKVQITAGIVGMLYALVSLALTVKANIWENALYLSNKQQTPFNTVLIFQLGVAWMGLWMLMAAWRDYVRASQGRPLRRLDSASARAIEAAVASGDIAGASAIYRKSFADAGAVEAHEHVQQVVDALRRQDPAKYETHFLRPWWDINVPKFAMVALIELALALGGFFVLKPAHVLESAWYLAGFASYGAAILISMRLRGATRRTLTVFTPIVLTFIGGDLLFQEHTANKMLLIVIGTFAGAMLMRAAYSAKRP